MSASTPGAIRPNKDLWLSSARPHLFENNYFPADGPLEALCRTTEKKSGDFENITTAQAVDKETLRVDFDDKYLDNVVGCESCRTTYRSLFQG